MRTAVPQARLAAAKGRRHADGSMAPSKPDADVAAGDDAVPDAPHEDDDTNDAVSNAPGDWKRRSSGCPDSCSFGYSRTGRPGEG
ncbi:uncharacterized protein UV8b_06571 [Ustilaginoidea virens]|uniref:Uncharacterized protein n=1 Tax=Ustilaginoidea virens TaxID=1159556 RepID=A0A8E5HVC8_USTVR|nr:uncharacterized protein UV8b_06571 [Ustilaginoidea virens]QUC22330.1 hypothetical protein UV8b_06571 [Ustilaginoidea virens]